MKKIGLIGCGKIGGAILRHITENKLGEIVFVLDPYFQGESTVPVLKNWDNLICNKAELIIECATAEVLEKYIEKILYACDLMPFSAAAFSEPGFYEKVTALCEKKNRHVYLPHGAILGLDGIFDGRKILSGVTVITTKNPKSLGRTDAEHVVVYEGTTRNACKLYPRNVNVHAEIALAGIGFDRTKSVIISDPSVNTNTHLIKIEGQGIHFEILVSSFATGGVTGAYTPLSACGSIDRLLGTENGITFV